MSRSGPSQSDVALSDVEAAGRAAVEAAGSTDERIEAAERYASLLDVYVASLPPGATAPPGLVTLHGEVMAAAAALDAEARAEGRSLGIRTKGLRAYIERASAGVDKGVRRG